MSATLFAMDSPRDFSLILDKVSTEKIGEIKYRYTCRKAKKFTWDKIDKIFQEIAEISKATKKVTAVEIEICLISYKKAKYLAGKAGQHGLTKLVVPHNRKYDLTYDPNCREIPKRPWRARKTKNRRTTSTKNPNCTANRLDQRAYSIPSGYGTGYGYYCSGKSNLVGIPGGF